MSSNSGPAKVRVLSSASGPQNEPSRRRGDIGGQEGQEVSQPVPLAEPPMAQGSSSGGRLLWVAGAVVLFVISAALGGLLVTVSLLYPDVI